MDQYLKLCEHDWAMGSNGVDFLRPKLIRGLAEENEVKTLIYLVLGNEDEHYKCDTTSHWYSGYAAAAVSAAAG